MQHVVNCLHTNDLTGRGDQRNLAEFLANARQFLVDLVDSVKRVHFTQLADQIGEHSARRLVQENVDIDDRNLGVIQQMLVLRHHLFLEDLVDLGQLADVETGIAIGSEQRHHQRLDGRVRSTVGIRGHAGVEDIDAGFDGLELAH